jgi:hypothetical protein
MKTYPHAPTALVTLIIALAGCDIGVVAPTAVLEDAQFGKEVFTRCKPHVASAESTVPQALVVVPEQTVEVELGEGGGVDGRFHSILLVGDGGEACGQARLELGATDPGVANLCPWCFILIAYTGATVSMEDHVRRVEFAGEAQVCPEREDCRIEPVEGNIEWDTTSDDEPIYQFHAGGVYGFPARTIFTAPGPGDDDADR